MLRSRHWIRTAASTEPVTLPEARQQLRIDHTEDNEDIANMIVEVRLDCETRLGDVSLIDATCIDYFNVFADEMELHWSPVDSITQYVARVLPSIQRRDPNHRCAPSAL